MRVSVCIATCRRPERLAGLLEDLRHQQHPPDQVVIVDNDAAGSARAIVQRFSAAKPPFAVDYDIQPDRNIAMTRNRTVALARGEWIAFVDDDERAPNAWLRQLIDSAAEYEADGVLGPVEPQVPSHAPAWIRRGRFYDFARALLQLAIALGLALMCLPTGRHRAVAWLMRAAANAGKLTAFLGWRQRAYA